MIDKKTFCNILKGLKHTNKNVLDYKPNSFEESVLELLVKNLDINHSIIEEILRTMLGEAIINPDEQVSFEWCDFNQKSMGYKIDFNNIETFYNDLDEIINDLRDILPTVLGNQ